jgi:hypothetical protein
MTAPRQIAQVGTVIISVTDHAAAVAYCVDTFRE